ncbi:MAG: tannase/feruloyl esterase family alpha/beta hydrolase [Sphingomonadales bacterium]|nr:tannase/feruloyl esterase family alpha/beta hydrolase [Sphingomonadales bacterium]
MSAVRKTKGRPAMHLKIPALFTAFAASVAATPVNAQAAGACDASLAAAVAGDGGTRIVLTRAFRAGEALALDEKVTDRTPRAAHDLCLVKLVVGPGHPGPADAPSTSAGIGIEVWLPAPSRWNHRLHLIGGGGWVGGWAGSAQAIAEPRAAMVADGEGAVSSSTDAGHAGTIAGTPSSGGDFAMTPEGGINHRLWEDFSSRAIHEQAVKTRALATAFYGTAPAHAYWDGSSTGGRQALKLAQAHPEDFDGILANMPAIEWTRFTVSGVYAQLVMQRDLGGHPLSEAQLDHVSTAAIAVCDSVGGRHLGYILDEAACRYDPVTDPAVLCIADGGSDGSDACVSRREALAIDKMWYGPTSDGSVPSPALDNGWDSAPGGRRLWFGLPRGTSLYNAHYSRLFHVNAGFANPGGPWTLASDQIALDLQDPTIAAPNFHNATGNGADGWKRLTYPGLARAYARGLALDRQFARINTDDPDLSAFRARGGRMLSWQGLNDEVIPVQGLIHYYAGVVRRMGGLAATQRFYRLYLVPGNGHGPYNGTANPAAAPPHLAGSQLYDALVAWVEGGVVPDRLEIASGPDAAVQRSQPVCPWPQAARYTGADPDVAASYACAVPRDGSRPRRDDQSARRPRSIASARAW